MATLNIATDPRITKRIGDILVGKMKRLPENGDATGSLFGAPTLGRTQSNNTCYVLLDLGSYTEVVAECKNNGRSLARCGILQTGILNHTSTLSNQLDTVLEKVVGWVEGFQVGPSNRRFLVSDGHELARDLAHFGVSAYLLCGTVEDMELELRVRTDAHHALVDKINAKNGVIEAMRKRYKDLTKEDYEEPGEPKDEDVQDYADVLMFEVIRGKGGLMLKSVNEVRAEANVPLAVRTSSSAASSPVSASTGTPGADDTAAGSTTTTTTTTGSSSPAHPASPARATSTTGAAVPGSPHTPAPYPKPASSTSLPASPISPERADYAAGIGKGEFTKEFGRTAEYVRGKSALAMGGGALDMLPTLKRIYHDSWDCTVAILTLITDVKDPADVKECSTSIIGSVDTGLIKTNTARMCKAVYKVLHDKTEEYTHLGVLHELFTMVNDSVAREGSLREEFNKQCREMVPVLCATAKCAKKIELLDAYIEMLKSVLKTERGKKGEVKKEDSSEDSDASSGDDDK